MSAGNPLKGLISFLRGNTPATPEGNRAQATGNKPRPSKSSPRPAQAAKMPKEHGNPHERKGKTRHRQRAQHDKKTLHGNWTLDQFPVAEVEGKKRFHDFGLPDTLMHAIADLGFEYCTPIQAEVLSSTLAGRDAIGKAQTGTGKTAAFLVSTIKQLIDVPAPEPRYLGEPRAVVIAPTRELALQIEQDALALTKYLDLNVVAVVGGMDYDKQLKKLHNDFVDILVATPGRLLDYYEKRELFLDLTEVMVIDEADRMLDMGFIPQVRRIIRATPRPGDRQTLLFSATFTDSVIRLGEQWTWKPVNVEIEPDHVATDTVDQKIYIVTEEDKYRLLTNLVRGEQLERVIVFANRRDQTRRLCERLIKDGLKADMLSGEVPQKKRVRTLEDFKSGKVQILVATDVAGRGIHIDGISHVVNYTLPEDPEDYVHRIGRTGRAGATGTSISFASEDDAFLIPDLEQLLGSKIHCEYPPAELLK